MPRTPPPDPFKRNVIEAQSETIAELLDVDAEDIKIDPRYGVMLTPQQAAQLIAMARR